MSIAIRKPTPIEWHEPKNVEVHELQMFDVACACPDDRCSGELRYTGESMPHTYGVRSHYHKCDCCQKVWLVKGHMYPIQKWVRIEHIEDFLRYYGGKTSEQAPDPTGSKAARGRKNP
jgi:hypothetical protein